MKYALVIYYLQGKKKKKLKMSPPENDKNKTIKYERGNTFHETKEFVLQEVSNLFISISHVT